MDMFRVQSAWQLPNGDDGLSTHYFAKSTQSAQTVADAVVAYWTAMRTNFAASASVTTVPDVASVDQVTGQVTGTDVVTTAKVQGAAVGDPMPGFVQGLARLLTPTYVNGRRVQGRLFLPAVTESSSGADGRPVATYSSNYTAAGPALIAKDLGWVVWARTAGTVAFITATPLAPEWAILSSRRG